MCTVLPTLLERKQRATKTPRVDLFKCSSDTSKLIIVHVSKEYPDLSVHTVLSVHIQEDVLELQINLLQAYWSAHEHFRWYKIRFQADTPSQTRMTNHPLVSSCKLSTEHWCHLSSCMTYMTSISWDLITSFPDLVSPASISTSYIALWAHQFYMRHGHSYHSSARVISTD